MSPLRMVLAAATLLAFQPLAGAEELTPAAFLRGDTPDEGVHVTMNAGVSYRNVILLDYADGWARIFYGRSTPRIEGGYNGQDETWIQASNIAAIQFPSALYRVKEEERRAAALEIKKKLKEEAAAMLENAKKAAQQPAAPREQKPEEAPAPAENP